MRTVVFFFSQHDNLCFLVCVCARACVLWRIRGVQGCEEFDDFEMENVFYCEDSCAPGCVSTDSATRDEATDYAQCQNIASRMVQKEALAHAQVCVCVCVRVCVCACVCV